MTREDLISRIKGLAQDAFYDSAKIELDTVGYDELTKFPELKEVIVSLLTKDFDSFLSSIDWVAPRPTTFRINLKNERDFYLIFNKESWTAQVEGKKYYLKNLPEEQRAAEAISRILRYTEASDLNDEPFLGDPMDANLEGGDLGDEPQSTGPGEEVPGDETPEEEI